MTDHTSIAPTTRRASPRRGPRSSDRCRAAPRAAAGGLAAEGGIGPRRPGALPHAVDQARCTRWATDTWRSLVAMTDAKTGLPADNINGDLVDGRSRATPRRPTSVATCGAPWWPATCGSSSPGRVHAAPRAPDPRDPAADEAPRAERHVLQLVRRGDGRGPAHLAGDRQHASTRSSPASTTAGSAPLCWSCGTADPEQPPLADRLFGRMRWDMFYNPDAPRARGADARRLLHVRPPTDRDGAYTRQPHRRRPRRLVHHPPLRHDRVGDPDHLLPRHHHGPGPGEALLRACGAPSRRAATGPGTRCSRSGRPAPTSGIDVFEGAYTYRGMHIVPGWGGSMFEELMPDVFVPEASWAPRSLGRQPPAARPRPARARPRRGGLRLLGLLARRATPSAATASTASTRSASTPRATSPTRRRPTTTPASATAARATNPTPSYGDGVVTPHAAFLAMMHEPAAGLRQPRRASRTSSRPTATGGFYDAVAVDSGKIARRYLSLDQAMVMGRIGNVLADNVIRRAFATPEVERALRPVIGMEQFGAGWPDASRMNADQPRGRGVPRPQQERADGPVRGPAAARRGAGRRPADAALAGREGRADVPDRHRGRRGRHGARAPGRDQQVADLGRGARQAPHPLQRPRPRRPAHGGPVAQRPPGPRRADATRHTGHDLHGPAPRVHRERGGLLHRQGLLAVARAPRPGRPARRRRRCAGSPTSPARSTARSASGPRCTRRSTWRPSRGGPGRRARSGRTPTSSPSSASPTSRASSRTSSGRAASPARASTSPAAARRRTARTRTSPTAASRSTPVGGSPTTSSRSRRSSRPGTAAIMPYYGMPVGARDRRREDRGGRLRLQPPDRHRPAAREARLRRRGRHRLGARQRQPRRRPGAAGPRLGRRAPRPARPHGADHRRRRRPVRRRGVRRASCSTSSPQGRVSEERIDESARRLLAVKFRLGLFDNPYVDEDAGRGDRWVARTSATRGMPRRPRSVTVLPERRRRHAPGAAPARRGCASTPRTSRPRRWPRLGDPGASGPRTPTSRSCGCWRRSSRAPTCSWSRGSTRARSTSRRAWSRAWRASPPSCPLVVDVVLDRPAVLTPLLPIAGGARGQLRHVRRRAAWTP